MRTARRRHNDKRVLAKRKRGVWPKRYRWRDGHYDLSPREAGMLTDGAPVTWHCDCTRCQQWERRREIARQGQREIDEWIGK